MKRFRFSLQAPLLVRQRTEQKAREKYANALAARQRALERLSAVHREQSEWWARWRTEMSRGCAAGALVQWAACDRTLTEQRQRAETAVSEAETASNQALQEMLLARRDREVVEKHLQRQRDQYGRELGREEQKTMDDLAQRRALPVLNSDRSEPTSL
jgi:flagellar export protein FliJ